MNIDLLSELNSLFDINVFCLYGDYGVGKTYLADQIAGRYPDSFVRVSFAKKVKENFVKTIEPSLTLEDLNDREIKEKYRSEIIDYAENMKKFEGADVWANLLIQEIEEIHRTKNINNFIIDDLRFEIEYETLFKEYRENVHLIHLVNKDTPVDPHTLVFRKYVEESKIQHYTIYNDFTDNVIEVLECVINRCFELVSRFIDVSPIWNSK